MLWNTSGGGEEGGGADCKDGKAAMRPEELVVAVGDTEEREAKGVGFKEGDD